MRAIRRLCWLGPGPIVALWIPIPTTAAADCPDESGWWEGARREGVELVEREGGERGRGRGRGERGRGRGREWTGEGRKTRTEREREGERATINTSRSVGLSGFAMLAMLAVLVVLVVLV